MQAHFGVGETFGFLLLAGLAVGYSWGWWRLRHAMPALATRPRLFAFFAALCALTLALVWPLPDWSNYLLTMRSLQKVLICMVAAPLLWLTSPVHVLAWGIRGQVRHAFVALHTRGRGSNLIRGASQPLVAWFCYLAAFLFWHDPAIARFLLGEQAAHIIAPWLLLGAALLFWWPVIDTGPRLHRNFPAGPLIIYLLSVEIANMVAGITIAFAAEPLYPYYPALRASLAPNALPWGQTTDQIMGGAIVWVFGSLVYISSIVYVLGRLFRKDGSTAPQPPVNWDDDAKFIAPGLEHRVAQNELRKVDLSHR